MCAVLALLWPKQGWNSDICNAPGVLQPPVSVGATAEYARVVFQKTVLSDAINSAGWIEWSSSEPNTEDVLFGEYDNAGDGAEGTRASFATKLSSAISITSILGSDYKDWIDISYIS
jgi:pectinesterase